MTWPISEAETGHFTAQYGDYLNVGKCKWLIVNAMRNPLKAREFMTEGTVTRENARIFGPMRIFIHYVTMAFA